MMTLILICDYFLLTVILTNMDLLLQFYMLSCGKVLLPLTKDLVNVIQQQQKYLLTTVFYNYIWTFLLVGGSVHLRKINMKECFFFFLMKIKNAGQNVIWHGKDKKKIETSKNDVFLIYIFVTRMMWMCSASHLLHLAPPSLVLIQLAFPFRFAVYKFK